MHVHRPAHTPAAAALPCQVFLARPWSPSRPLPIAGFIIKQTMTQAALECLLRGTLVLGLQGVVRDAVAQVGGAGWSEYADAGQKLGSRRVGMECRGLNLWVRIQ